MRGFEVMYIINPDVNAEEFSRDVNIYIVKNGGSIKKNDIWGKKRLAYEVQDLSEGIYVLTSFVATNELVKALDVRMRGNQYILRHMIISLGE